MGQEFRTPNNFNRAGFILAARCENWAIWLLSCSCPVSCVCGYIVNGVTVQQQHERNIIVHIWLKRNCPQLANLPDVTIAN